MSKPDLTSLVNSALVSIGQEPIVSLDNKEELSPIVTSVNTQVDLVKRELLRCNDWNCARKVAKLAKVADKKALGWEYVYQLPTDPECLRVVQISLDKGHSYIDLDDYYNHNRGPKEALFDLDGDYLLCNYGEIYIKYTANIDPANFDPNLASAFVAQLAADLAYSLPASVTLAEYMSKRARQKLKIAKSLNARERNILRPEGDVIAIRYYNSDRHLRVDMSDQMGSLNKPDSDNKDPIDPDIPGLQPPPGETGGGSLIDKPMVN